MCSLSNSTLLSQAEMIFASKKLQFIINNHDN